MLTVSGYRALRALKCLLAVTVLSIRPQRLHVMWYRQWFHSIEAVISVHVTISLTEQQLAHQWVAGGGRHGGEQIKKNSCT